MLTQHRTSSRSAPGEREVTGIAAAEVEVAEPADAVIRACRPVAR